MSEDTEEELAMTEQEWEAWQAKQPPPQDDPEEEPTEPWAREDSHAGGWHGWR
jgi:hypothetical protein